MPLSPPPRSSSSPAPATAPISSPSSPPPPAVPSSTVARPTARSHQTGVIEEHWNDLPSHLLPASRTASRTASRSTSPRPPTQSSSNSTTPPPTAEFPGLLERLFISSPSSLAARERQMCYTRIQKAEPTITEVQREELGDVMSKVLDGKEDPAWGRERVVEFMMRERGVAGWAAGLRRGLECVVREE